MLRTSLNHWKNKVFLWKQKIHFKQKWFDFRPAFLLKCYKCSYTNYLILSPRYFWSITNALISALKKSLQVDSKNHESVTNALIRELKKSFINCFNNLWLSKFVKTLVIFNQYLNILNNIYKLLRNLYVLNMCYNSKPNIYDKFMKKMRNKYYLRT